MNERRSYVVHSVSRAFGLVRDIYTARCECGWRAEARELHTASVLRRNHVCPPEAA